MKKLVNFSVALMTTTLLCLSCQKEDVVAQMDVTTTKSENVQKGKTAHVSYKDAIQIATEAVAMLEGGATTRSGIKRRVDPSKIKYHVTPTTRSGEGGDTLYYVVNYADNAGFALVSTSRAEGDPLIAVTEQGNFTPGEETGNPGFDMYISLLNDRPSPKPEDGPTSPIDTTFHGFGPFYETIILEESEVEALLTVRWGQEAPYNMFCFTKDTNEQALAGCTAIAMAQIMSYYRYPTSFNRTHDSTMQNVILNWNEIVASPTMHNSSENNKLALAHLIREFGGYANMSYGINISNALYSDVSYAIKALGYTASVSYYNYDLVENELQASRPVYVLGQSLSGGGHAWIIDGYKKRTSVTNHYVLWEDGVMEFMYQEPMVTNKYLHINWGYDGDNNGYYYADVFDMSAYYELDTGVAVNEELHANYNGLIRVYTGLRPSIDN